MLVVKELTKRFEDRVAVDALGFEVRAGEILGLVGPNGAGKTTTLRCVAGILAPDAGAIAIDGVDLAADPLAAKRRLGLVPDEPHLFARLSVWEHLELAARLYDVSGWEPLARELLDELELAARRDTLAEALSRGMRQKVAVASALIHAPSLLMLDEPLVGLDPRGIRTLFATLRRHAGSGRAVVMSSHLLGQIEPHCTRFLILRAGAKLFHGSKAEIAAMLPAMRHDASLEEIFFGATEAPHRARCGSGPPMSHPLVWLWWRDTRNVAASLLARVSQPRGALAIAGLALFAPRVGVTTRNVAGLRAERELLRRAEPDGARDARRVLAARSLLPPRRRRLAAHRAAHAHGARDLQRGAARAHGVPLRAVSLAAADLARHGLVAGVHGLHARVSAAPDLRAVARRGARVARAARVARPAAG